jgi:hypothetical protein
VHRGKDLGTARDGDYLNTPHPRVQTLDGAIAAGLGHPDWLDAGHPAPPTEPRDLLDLVAGS